MYCHGMADHQTFADVINSWPNASTLALDIGVQSGTVRAWKVRGIPAEYWADILAAALRRDLPGITCELLASLAAKGAGRKPPQESRAGA